MRIALAQMNPTVGDISSNTKQIIEFISQAREIHHADIVVFPELALCGYPPEDLILRDDLHELMDQAIAEIAAHTATTAVVLGHPLKQNDSLFNAASFLWQGKTHHIYRKQMLPNYSVFDEKRYFKPGDESCVFKFKGLVIGLVICEDLWFEEPVKNAVFAGAQIILAPNASPYHFGHPIDREFQITTRAKENKVGIIYLNQVGGQDELVFDGRSLAVGPNGNIQCEMQAFESSLACVEWRENDWHTIYNDAKPCQSDDEERYRALVTGVRDYVLKNGFKGAILGLSGGIDSALTLAIAVDALGKQNVQAVMMPFRYTAQMSVEDARLQAENLGVAFDIISIEPIYESFMTALKGSFNGLAVDTTEQNLQARCRGTLLMALSNKTGRMVLTTGNKSEMAVGYATLYGDMAGGFDVLKDVPKQLVYRLSEYRNTVDPVIPLRVITRAPSAELAPDQKDEDNLPPYDILDGILEAYVVKDLSVAQIVALGYQEETVRQIMRMVDRNEHKRRQAAPGVRISKRAFGRDRRYPITSGFSRQI